VEKEKKKKKKKEEEEEEEKGEEEEEKEEEEKNKKKKKKNPSRVTKGATVNCAESYNPLREVPIRSRTSELRIRMLQRFML
jgi:hypothetical protein